ncbi:MAG: radical SAM protein [Bacteroidales bacterium]|nr:radical SAM protein [Bacteroidales bacterium]
MKFLRKEIPLQSVIFITDKCNLSCRHCAVYNLENPIMKSYSQIKQELEYSYKKGARFVDFEGGEPTLWQEDGKDINSLVSLAKEIGFFSTTITTNAQNPFEQLQADSLWISLDGVGKYHNQIRGEGTFEKLDKNISLSLHKALSVNMVINSLNYPSIEETLEYVKQNPHIKKISFNFHTPFSGTEYLQIDKEKRINAINTIIKYKKQGYPIMNSISGLKLMKENNFKKRCWIANFILVDGTRLKECTGKTYGVCDNCGFGMASEMHSVFNLRIDTIIAGLKLRIG